MISAATDKHEKHVKLARASYGEWGRNELAIIGTTCEEIKALATCIIQQLPSFKIAYVDADHVNKNDSSEDGGIINTGAIAGYTDKIVFTQLNIASQPNAFQRRILLNDCDLILVNGNHFTAAKQIVVIDDRKPLERKLDRITNVQMILTGKSSSKIPAYLSQHIPAIAQLPLLSTDSTEAIVQYIKKCLQEEIPTINGLVLSGGKSTRMGRDKGSIEYHNKSQRDFAFDLLSTCCNEVFISCNAEQSRSIIDTPKIEDAFLNLGPLSGILSAFQYNPNIAWLTIACDLPFLTEDVIAHLILHRNPSKLATAFMDAQSKFPEPLVTIWEPKAYPVLLQFLAQGYSCPRKVLINSDVELLTAPDDLAFKNVNTTEEYREALSLLQMQAQPAATDKV